MNGFGVFSVAVVFITSDLLDSMPMVGVLHCTAYHCLCMLLGCCSFRSSFCSFLCCIWFVLCVGSSFPGIHSWWTVCYHLTDCHLSFFSLDCSASKSKLAYSTPVCFFYLALSHLIFFEELCLRLCFFSYSSATLAVVPSLGISPFPITIFLLNFTVVQYYWQWIVIFNLWMYLQNLLVKSQCLPILPVLVVACLQT